jgi:GNAT superfamily N-acetyltransferase
MEPAPIRTRSRTPARRELEIRPPAGYTLVSLADRPDLADPAGAFNVSVWPEFMLQDSEADQYWHLLDTVFGDYQLVLLDADGAIAATNNSAPLRWDGTDGGLPDGWDRQFEQTARDLESGAAVNTLGALQIVVDPARRGTGLGGFMIEAMRANARAHGLGAVIACVRPTGKDRYPLIPIEQYAFWTRPDGEPFDAWIRLHVRLGGRIVRGSPRAMTIRGTIAEWELWTGQRFPGSGDYLLPVAAAPVTIDLDADMGAYFDPNVWIVHDVVARPARAPGR